MRTSRDELPVEQLDAYRGWITDFGDWKVAFESMPANFPPDPSIFHGLPDDRCQALHLGFVIKGSFRVTYLDGSEELVRAGDAYCLTPGHFVQSVEPVEVVEFSPREEMERTLTQVAANLSAARIA